MEKILVVGCKKVMDEACIACSRCMVAFNRRIGAFAAYKDTDAELVGMMHCGDCPGVALGQRLVQMHLWNKPMQEQPTQVHVASCITDSCPYRRKLINTLTERSAVPVVEGAHPFRPAGLFASE